MKLRPKYESVRSSLLNRSLVPSFDICFSELLREEQRLSTQAILEQSHGSSKTATVAYPAQGRGPPMHSKNLRVSIARNMGILLPLVLRSFVLIARRRVTLSKNVVFAPRIVRPKHFKLRLLSLL